MISFLLKKNNVESYNEIFNNQVNDGIPLYTTPFYIYNSASSFDFSTRSREIRIKCYANYTGTSWPPMFYLKIDGVLKEHLTTNGQYVIIDTGNNNLKNIKIAHKFIEVASPLTGCWIQSVIIDTNKYYSIITKPRPATRYLFFGDSITQGGRATSIYSQGFAGLYRDNGHDVTIGGASAYSISLMYAEINRAIGWISSMMDSLVSNKLILILGTNDYQSNAATISTYYNTIIDGIHAIRPDIHIYCCAPYLRSSEVNLPAIRTNIQQTCTDRPTFTTFINLRDVVPLSHLPDGLHPDDYGHALLFNYLNTLI